jgi:mRNA-degrading endonuclease RelE of RelBE toxin-antitoxin system
MRLDKERGKRGEAVVQMNVVDDDVVVVVVVVEHSTPNRSWKWALDSQLY